MEDVPRAETDTHSSSKTRAKGAKKAESAESELYVRNHRPWYGPDSYPPRKAWKPPVDRLHQQAQTTLLAW